MYCKNKLESIIDGRWSSFDGRRNATLHTSRGIGLIVTMAMGARERESLLILIFIRRGVAIWLMQIVVN